LTAVGLVVTALVSLTSGTEEATKAQKEFNEELRKDTATELSKFDALRRTIENVNLSLGTRKKALEELRGQFPAYFKDLKDEEILAGNVKIQYESLRDALIQTAEARALQNRIQKQQESLLDVEDKYIAAQKERIKLEKELRDLQNQPGGRVIGGGGITSGQVTARGGEEVILANRLTSARKEEQKLLKEKNGLQAKIKSDAGRITDIQIETDKYTGKTLEKEKDITKEKKEQVITNTKLLALEQDRAQAFEDLQAILSFESVSEPTILTDQEKILENLQKIYDTVRNVVPDINGQLSELFNVTATQFPDPFKDIINSTDKFVGLLTKVPVEFKDIIGAFKTLKLDGDLSKFTDEQKQDLTSYFNVIKTGANGLKVALQSINKDVQISDEEVAAIFKKGLDERAATLARVKAGEITEAQAQLEIQKSLILLISEKLNLDKDILKGTEKSTEEQTKQFNNALKLNDATKEVAGAITQSVVALAQFGQEVNKQGEEITKNNEKIKSQVAEIDKLLKTLNPSQISELLQSIGFDFQKALTYVVINAETLGKETATAFLKGTTQIPIDFENMTRKQLKNLENTLKIAMIELEKYGIDAEGVFQKLFVQIEQSAKEKLIASIQEGIESFQAALNSLGQTTSLYFESQFDILEKRYTRLQDSIVGDSEEANKKRLEAEKSYQAQKAELEKKAAKTALRISLAQALANTAEAITKLAAITGGVGAVIGAGAIVAFNAAQVAIIGSQLANIDSYRRGGKLGSGGMVSGPAHEYGGVKFQGGGIELEGNEAVINRYSSINYMGLLDQINQAGGGRPIQPAMDDSRIVEAIAKQRNTPIRAYVVESDITAKQETARRLEKLSQI
jgi:hypothetical protein